MNIQSFMDWAKEKPGKRHVQIEIKYFMGELECKAWVFDHDLLEGQWVEKASEIDIEKIAAEQQRTEYEKLKKKFEGAM